MASLNVTSATETLSIAGQELLGSWGGTVLYLFLFGILPLALFGIGLAVPFEYTFYIILGYIVISFIGWLVSKFIIDRVQGFEKQLGKGKRKKKTTEPVGY
jgi:hypothetical protein